MADIKIRRALDSDVDELRLLIQVAGGSLEQADSRIKRFFPLTDDKLILVLENSTRLLGYLGMKAQDDNDFYRRFVDLDTNAHINWIDIHPGFRRRGNGSRLLQSAVGVAKSWGKQGIWLACKEKSIGFYVKNGYVAVENYEERNGDSEEFRKKYVMWNGF